MTRTTLKIRKPRINLANLRTDLTEVVQEANDLNFGCHFNRNAFIADNLMARGHDAPKDMLVADLARMVGLRVENGVIFS
jgi:hypothetical protein